MDGSLVVRACARAGLPWEDALIVSAHELRRAVNACRAHPKVAVLTVPGAGPAELARALFPQTPRTFVVCEDLDGPDERVVRVRPAEATTRPWNAPQVVLVLDERRPPDAPDWIARPPGPDAWPLDDPAGATPGPRALDPQVLALALARLGPRTGDMVWDIGSGGGSIAAGCARFGAAAIAVGPDAASCERIRAAVRARRVRVAVSRGTLPSVLDHLPDPDAVFLADAGPSSVRACAARAPHRLVATADESRVPEIVDVLSEAGFTAQAATFRTTPVVSGQAPVTFDASPPVTLVWARRAVPEPAPPPARRARPVERTPPL
ncbi:SAM-dependent methyltransferase [Actinomadura algeriensis]|uniref:Precorrin-6Y C5,15-methyltransferase (Decarboxylating) n=1 Tax=Actinomadura algeriensis TaxID=1679523 RepID=A0ABR9JIS2_9ACTN|nr:hypothetical protein [Actinomadura algeriensis]MBE1530313.1 precorrin-6Y C5,15-methyltransferase (decarboxylating) [Actinomadura algeriensis]